MMQILAPKHWKWQQRSGCALKRESQQTLADEEESCTCTCTEASHSTIPFDDANSSRIIRGCLKKDSTCNQRKGQQQLSVSFRDVHVREFPVTLGDNPAVSAGVPITIKWDHSKEGTFSVDYYEGTIATKCCGKPETLSHIQRFCLLREAGISEPCINAAERDAMACKSGRLLTQQRLHLDFFEGALQALAKGTWNATLNRRKKKEQRKVLEQFLESDKANLATTTTSSCPFEAEA